MNEFKIPNEALVVVGDGEKALLLRNKGGPQDIKLEVENVLGHDNPATHEQGTDKPGRAFASAGTARSAMEETDWHQLGEDRFAVDIAGILYRLAHANKFEALVVVAPPKVLGTLRKAFHKEVVDRITGELPKNLTSHPIPDIEKLLTA
ncbi:MAG: host attachment family protein [Pseudomonadota bacterium]|nr:host attachment protein [Burkholderiaceae bacterium]MDQ3444775.1 host attachment family protein [Pseudomonadota bacterium]